MMGAGHATMGAATWLAVSAATPISVALVPGVDTKSAVVVGAVVTAGAALLPDLDHPQATISRSLPPLTNVVSHGVGAISGGHRNGTHGLPALAVVTALVALSFAGFWHGTIFGHPFGFGVAIFSTVLGALASIALKISFGSLGSWPTAILFGLASGFLLPQGAPWLPFAVGIGYAVHIFGDFLTTAGVPLLYPFSKKRFSLPLLGTAGSTREYVVTTLLSLYAIAAVVLVATGPGAWVS